MEYSQLVEMLFRQLLLILDDEDKSEIHGVNVVFLDTHRIVVGCRDDGGQPIIEVSHGTIAFLQAITHIFLLFIDEPSGPKPQRTASYRSAIQVARKFVSSDTKTLQLYIAMPPTHPLLGHAEELFRAQLTFLVAHELAHVILEHWRDSIPILGKFGSMIEVDLHDSHKFAAREIEADKKATTWIQRWDQAAPLESDLRLMGPYNTLRWIGYCQTMSFALIKEVRIPGFFPGSAPSGVIFSSNTGGYPAGTARATAYLEGLGNVCDGTKQLINANSHMIDLFLAAAEDPKLHERLWEGALEQ